MLPASLIAELYERELSPEEYERMLIVPEDSTFSYDPYRPLQFNNSSDAVSESQFMNFLPVPVQLSPPLDYLYSGAEDFLQIIIPREGYRSFRVPSSLSGTSANSSRASSPTGSINCWSAADLYSSTPTRDDSASPISSNGSSSSWISMELSEQSYRSSSFSNYSRRSREPRSIYCSFCFHNRESPSIYNGHNLRNAEKKITCPYLLQVVCRYCGATGPIAHTPKYCPMKGHYPTGRKFFKNRSC